MKQLLLLAALFAVFGAQGQTRQKHDTEKLKKHIVTTNRHFLVGFFGYIEGGKTVYGGLDLTMSGFPSAQALKDSIEAWNDAHNVVILSIREFSPTEYAIFWKDYKPKQ